MELAPAAAVFAVSEDRAAIALGETSVQSIESQTSTEAGVTDWSTVDWDKEVVLIPDQEAYDAEVERLVAEDRAGDVPTIRIKKHALSSEEAMHYFRVPTAVQEVVQSYRANTGIFQNKQTSENKKSLLESRIRAVMPGGDKAMRRAPVAEEHVIDLRTAPPLRGATLVPIESERSPEVFVRVKSRSKTTADHPLRSVTVERIADTVKGRGASKSDSGRKVTRLDSVLSFVKSIFLPEQVFADEVVPVISYYDGIESTVLDNALYYISQRQEVDGTFSQQTKYEETASIALMLSAIHRTDNTQFDDAIAYLTNTEPITQREKAIKARLMVGLGLPYVSYLDDVTAHKNKDHGYGIDVGYESDMETTLEVALAMYTADYSVTDKFPLAIYHVLKQIPDDGALKYRADSFPSLYLINKTAQSLYPFRQYTVGNEQGVSISVQSKIDALLGYLASQYDEETVSLVGTTDTIDEIMTLKTWKLYNSDIEKQVAITKTIKSEQYLNGSFDDSLRASSYAVRALGSPDLQIPTLESTGQLESDMVASFDITITNSGYAPASDAKVYLYADNVNTGLSLNLGQAGITIDANETVTISFDIPKSLTARFTGVVNMKFFVDTGADADFDDNWLYQDVPFASASSGKPALPLYFIAQQHQLSGSPALNIRWQVKADPLRSNYVVVFREKGTTQWSMQGIANTWNGAFLSGPFQEGKTYEVTAGVLHLNQTTVTYVPSDIAEVKMTADHTLYTGSTVGTLRLNEEAQPNTYVWSYGNSGTTDDQGVFSFTQGANGTNAAWADEDYLEPLVETFYVPVGATNTPSLHLRTRYKPDTEPPVLTSTELRWANGNIVKSGQSYTLFGWGTDNVDVLGGDFYLWTPSENEWSYVGSGSALNSSYALLEWTVPTDLPIGEGYKIKAQLYDYQKNYSNELEWVPFEIINGEPPNITVTYPNGGEVWDIGATSTITWDAQSFYGVNTVKLLYLLPNGSFRTIKSTVPNTGLYEWNVPFQSNYAGEGIKVKVTAYDSVNFNDGADESDNGFTMSDPSPSSPLPWSLAKNITADFAPSLTGGDMSNIKTAVDADGTTHVIFLYTHDTYASFDRVITQQLYHKSMTSSSDWSAPEKIYEKIVLTDENFTGFDGIEDMQFVIDTDGTFHLMWKKTANGGCSAYNLTDVMYMSFDGNEWSTPLNISNTNTNTGSPRMVVDGTDLYAVWLDGVSWTESCDASGTRQLQYKEMKSGSWGTTTQIATDGSASWPQIAKPLGEAPTVVFLKGGTNRGLYSITRGTTSWSSLSPIYIGDSDYNALAQGPNGSLHLAFRQWYSDPQPGYSRARILYSYYDGNTWTTSTEATPIVQGVQSEDPTLVVDNADSPHLFIRQGLVDGASKAVWYSSTAGVWSNGVYVSRDSQRDVGYGGVIPIYNPATNKLGGIYRSGYSFVTNLFYNEANLNLEYAFPEPVTSLTGQSVSGTVAIAWDSYVDSSDTFDHYEIFRSEASVSSTEGLVPISTVPDMQTNSFVDESTQKNKDYYYTVTVVSSGGTAVTAPWIGPFRLMDGGVTAEWKLDEPVWSGVAGEVLDSVGTAHGQAFGDVSTVADATVVSGKVGKFDGLDDYVSLPVTAPVDKDYTISAWYKTNTTEPSRMALVGGLSGGRSEIYIYNGKPGCRIWDTADRSIYTDEQYAGGWHQVVCAVSYGSQPMTTLYVDGVLKKSTQHAPTLVGGTWKIGKPGSSGAAYFNGFVDNVRVHSGMVSDDAVSSGYAIDKENYIVPEEARVISRWSMDEEVWSGETGDVKDSIGTAHGQSFGGAKTFTDTVTTAGIVARFDGADDYVSLPIVPKANEDFSISAWYKTSVTNQTRMTLVGGISGGRFEMYVHNGRPGCRIWDTAERSIYSDIVYTNGWHQVVCSVTYGDNPSTKLYVDGVLKKSTNYAPAIVGGNWKIGKPGGSAANYFHGIVDNVRLYKGAIEAQAVTTGYTTEKDIYKEIDGVHATAEWSMDEENWTGILGDVKDSIGTSDGQSFGGVSTVAESVFASGKSGQFDGLDDYVALPLVAQANKDYSVSAWYKTDNSTQTKMTLLGGLSGGRSEVYIHNGRPGCRIWDTTERSIYTDEQYDGGWHQVVCAVSYGSSSTTKLYVDGVLKKSTPHAPTLLGGTWKIGKPGASGAIYFTGLVDDVKIYNGMLSDQDVLDQYNT
jgi:hypothetical protein